MRLPIILASSVLFLSTLSASAATVPLSSGAEVTDTVLGIGAAGAASFGISALFSGAAKSQAVVAAPEISPEGIGGGLTLLSGTFLIMTGRRRKR